MAATKFYYFGFGSNMLAKRIQIQNPSAERVGAGRLDDFRLDFNTSSSRWRGAPATIVPTTGSHVYGAIWSIDMCNMSDLDNQESVDLGVYVPLQVPVLCISTNKMINCRAYHLCQQPTDDLRTLSMDCVPPERQPSKTYLKALIKGALETSIPPDYVRSLRSIKHNDTLVDAMEQQLELHEVDL